MTTRPLAIFAALAAVIATGAFAQVPIPLTQVAVVTQPVDIAHAGDGSGRLFIAEKPGTIRIFRSGAVQGGAFLDIRDRILEGDERGLLGIAFHPSFATHPYVYVDYTREPDGATVISRFTVPAATPDAADPASETILLTIDQPYANHNGGALRFGPDGFLYIGMGDGGAGNDPENRAQNTQTLLGKLLRIDVDGGSPYAIPPGNPFANGIGGRPEIYAIGLRNPWRIAFDVPRARLWIGDVGQDTREEVDMVALATAAGRNFGWRVVEGFLCTGLTGGPPCDSPLLTPPVIDYVHADDRCSVTGGEVYRGARLPAVSGMYVFADFCSGDLFYAEEGAGPTFTRRSLGRFIGRNWSTFGSDEAGDLYVGSLGGQVFRLGADVAPGSTTAVVEFRNAALDHYFMTADPVEIAGLDQGLIAGWQRTGIQFRAWTSQAAGSIPICRYYLPPADGNSHFFAANAAECDAVRALYPDAIFESPAAMFLAPPDTMTGACPGAAPQPIYRVWNHRPDTNHRYVTTTALRDQMVAAGGIAEGYGPERVTLCAPP